MIVPMSRVEIVCLSSVRAEMVQSLQRRGLLHIEEVPTELAEAPEFLRRVRLEGHEYDRLTNWEDAERLLNEIIPLLTVEPSREAKVNALGTAKKLPQTEWAPRIRSLASRLREDTRQRATLEDSIAVLENYKRILEDVTPALGGSDVKLGRGTRAVVLTGDVRRAVAKLDQRLREEIGPELKFHRQVEKKRMVGLLTFPEHRGDEVSRILGQEGVTPVDMRDEAFEGATVGQVIAKIDAKLTEQRGLLAEVQSRLETTSREIGPELIALRLMVGDELAQLRVQGQFAQSTMLTVIHGWTPADFYRDLEKAIEREFVGKATVNRLDEHAVPHTHVPTQLRNHRVFQPFEVLLSFFRPPTYGTLDPTVLVAISFILFYGFILGDVVYGIAVIFFAKWLRKKFGHVHPAVISASQVGVYMGWSAIIFGVIFGEYAGNLGERAWEYFGLPGHLPYLFHRAHETTQLLIWALIFGLIHVPLAMILGIREDFRHGHTKHAIEKLGLFMGLTAAVIGVCVYFQTEPLGYPVFTGAMVPIWTYLAAGLLIVGVILLFYAMGAMGLIGVLEIMSLGGNVLSYARLMALGIASIALADIANDLPEMMGIIIGVPAAVAVHLLNIGIGMASPTIHSLRLNLVEFLPKFYNPQGKPFNPFKKETQT